jgi:hypothetical protein
MLKYGKAYLETSQQAYEKLFKERTLHNLQRKARELGFHLTPAIPSAVVSLGGRPGTGCEFSYTIDRKVG